MIGRRERNALPRHPIMDATCRADDPGASGASVLTPLVRSNKATASNAITARNSTALPQRRAMLRGPQTCVQAELATFNGISARSSENRRPPSNIYAASSWALATNKKTAQWLRSHAAPRSSRAHGVVVSHPLRVRKALGSIPSVSICD